MIKSLLAAYVVFAIVNLVRAESIELKKLDAVAPPSVAENCNYATERCGPVFGSDWAMLHQKNFLFTAIGSGIEVFDVTNPSDLISVDLVHLCPGSRSIVASAQQHTIDVWSVGSSEFCTCLDPANCSFLKVEIDGEFYDASEGRVSSIRLSEVPIEGEVALADPVNACSALTNPAQINGKIALLQRGSCSFTMKLTHALQAGAIGVIVGNNHFNDPFSALMTMTGEEVAIPSVMISKPAFESVVAKLKNGAVVAKMGSEIGTGIPDPRYVPYQGLTKVTFDGVAFSEPVFYPSMLDQNYHANGVSLNKLYPGWLLTNVLSEFDTKDYFYVLDITVDPPMILGNRNITTPYWLVNVTGDVYAVTQPVDEYSVLIWNANNLDELLNDEPVSTPMDRFIPPEWNGAEIGFDGDQFWFFVSTVFGGGLTVVDTSYFPFFYDSRTFWPPTVYYDVTAPDFTILSKDHTYVITGWSSEGITIHDATDPTNLVFLGGMDTYPSIDADHTVTHNFFTYTDTDFLVVTSNAEILSLRIVPTEEPGCPECEQCEECPTCEDDHNNAPNTIINLNFGGMIPPRK